MMYEVIESKIILEGERLAKNFTEQGLAPYQLEDVLIDMIDTENGFEIQ